MRRLGYLNFVGIALGFMSATQAPGLASTLHPSSEGRGETWRGEDHLMQLPKHSEGAQTPLFASESMGHVPFKDKSIATLLLDDVQHPSTQNDVHAGPSLLSDADDKPAQAVSATPLPAALPLFAGGLGILGFLGRRRKKALNRG
jgi:hypothetical protein